jgi:hypothetical protein
MFFNYGLWPFCCFPNYFQKSVTWFESNCVLHSTISMKANEAMTLGFSTVVSLAGKSDSIMTFYNDIRCGSLFAAKKATIEIINAEGSRLLTNRNVRPYKKASFL